MKNVDRLAKYITQNGAEDIMVHTIPGTSNWIICQKIEDDKWLLTMGAPMGNITYNLGTVTTSEHLKLWQQLIKLDIEKKSSQIVLANQLRDKIYNFKKSYEKNIYKNFLKKETKEKVYKCWCQETELSVPHYHECTNKKTTKQSRIKLRKKPIRLKKSIKTRILRISNSTRRNSRKHI